MTIPDGLDLESIKRDDEPNQEDEMLHPLMEWVRTPTGPGIRRTLAVVTVIALATACGGDDENGSDNDITPPGDTDEVATMQAFVTDPDEGAGDDTEYTGTMVGRADIEVSVDRTTWRSLGPSRSFEIELRNGDDLVELSGSSEVPAGTYRWIRINFADVEASLEPGSRVGGETLASVVHLRLGDTGRAVTSSEVDPFELSESESAHVVLELHSPRWVTADNLTRRQIPKEEFENEAALRIVSGD